MERKTILIYSLSDLSRDERVQRQILSCAKEYNVISVGVGEYAGPVIRHIDLKNFPPAPPSPASSLSRTASHSTRKPRTLPTAATPHANTILGKHWTTARNEGPMVLLLLGLRKLIPDFFPIQHALASLRQANRAKVSLEKAGGRSSTTSLAQRAGAPAKAVVLKQLKGDAWEATRDADWPFCARPWLSEPQLAEDAPKRIANDVFQRLGENFARLDAIEREDTHATIIAELGALTFDVAIANDVTAINIVVPVALNKGARVIYDAHEFSPGQRVLTEKTAWSLYYSAYLLGKYLPLCDDVMTVCQSIADEYVRWFDIKPLTVITNAPRFVELTPSSVLPNRVRLVHHGLGLRPRELELMIKAVMLLDDRFSLDLFLLTPDQTYFEELKLLAEPCSRIRFLPPVPSGEIAQALNAYDMGFYILPPVNFNHQHALPNKFFEFAQARLGIAIGPSNEMSSYVKKFGLGIVSTEFTPDAMAIALSKVTPERLNEFKENAHRHAGELSAAPQMTKLDALIKAVVELDRRQLPRAQSSQGRHSFLETSR